MEMLWNGKGLLPLLVATVLLLPPYAVVVYGRSSRGFINIDCGKEKDDIYTDPHSGLVYTSDFDYIDTGEIHRVDPSLVKPEHYKQAHDLRSFPTGKRNCYTIKSGIEKGGRYLVKTSFMYGNYDGKNEIPEFDLYLGVNFWTTIFIHEASVNYIEEIITVTTSDQVSVCLINTGWGTPFISVLELRPLPFSLYEGKANTSQALVLYDRINFGGSRMRYPEDSRDRLWNSETFDGLETVSTTSSVISNSERFEIPSAVMMTAIYPEYGRMFSLEWTARRGNPSFHVLLHFAELEDYPGDEMRAFTIKMDGDHVTDPIHLSYLKTTTFSSKNPITSLNFAIVGTSESTLPPIINALELYMVSKTTGSETDDDDVNAIAAIKAAYKVKKNWMGDPCFPSKFRWDGLKCRTESLTDNRITYVDLSSSRLTGEISTSFAKLSKLEYLDLSGNELTGSVPDILASLTHLKFLDISNNRLSGPLPKTLLRRSAEGMLTLKHGDDPDGGNGDDDPDGGNRDDDGGSDGLSIGEIIGIAVGVFSGLSVILIFILWWCGCCPHSEDSRANSGQNNNAEPNNPPAGNVTVATNEHYGCCGCCIWKYRNQS